MNRFLPNKNFPQISVFLTFRRGDIGKRLKIMHEIASRSVPTVLKRRDIGDHIGNHNTGSGNLTTIAVI